MSTPSAPDLGKIVTDPTIRKVIYSIYTVAVLVVGAIQIAFAATGAGQPTWLIGVLAVIGYLGAPVGGLALVNTNSKTVEDPSGDDQVTASDI
jgi:hypothetical protein